MFEILITSSLLILALALLRRVWRSRISPVFTYALWLMAAVRLLLPVPVFGNVFSVMNLVNPVVLEAEEWVENRGEESGAEDGASGYPANSQVGENPMTDETGNTGLTRERQHSGAGGEGTEGKENLLSASQADSESSRKDGDRENDSLSLQKQDAEYPIGRLARSFWYVGIGIMAVAMLLFNGMFRYRLCRERHFLCRRGRVRIYEAELLDSPCLYGIFRPAVYLTPDCPERCREHAIAHELTHFRHGDHIWVLVRSLCVIVYWFDPFVWMAVYLSSKDCELACDAGTIRRLGEGQREAYGRTLIEMACASAGPTRILRCATDLSCGKKELKERIAMIAGGKKKMGAKAILPVLYAVLLAACTFGGAGEENVKGGYAESIVELPVSTVFEDFVQGEEGIRLVDYFGNDYCSLDGGESFVPSERIPNADRRLYATVISLKGGPDGSRIFVEIGTEDKWRLVTSEGKIIDLEIPVETENFYPYFYRGTGCFYMKNGLSVYRTDAGTGETGLLMECTGYPLYMAADEKLLYVATTDGLVLYDLEKSEIASRQDEVLSEFLGDREDILLYPRERGVYVVLHEGIYWHELYGDSVECLMDGEMYELGDRDRKLVGMAVVRSGEKDSFLVYCSDGTLMRYDYDGELVPVQDALRVYSIYEDSNIRRAVTKFRVKYPDIPIKYEVAIRSGYAMTLEDALKNLSTELAAGKGPDILVMDDIPYASYLQKGVLAELSSLREQMTEETHFLSVIEATNAEAAGSSDKLYMVPLAFTVPVLAGDEDAIRDVRSLTELADLLVETGEKNGGSVIGTVNAREILSLLAQSSMGAWVPDGEIDREALTEFISQAKRIYEVQMKGVPEEKQGRIVGAPDDETILMRRFGYFGMGEASNAAYNKFSMFPEQPFYAGYLGEKFSELNGYLEIDGKGYGRMPGQKYGACIPISMAAMNSASKAREECGLFLEYALSEEFQGEAQMKGFPVSRGAYLKKQENPNDEGYENMPYLSLRVWDESGNEELRKIYWPDEAVFEELDTMIGEIREVNLCEGRVFEEVLQQGEKVLTGSLSVEEGVDAVVRALEIYLAE